MDELRYPLLALARLRMGIDGEGITTLVAGAGCPLHCRWCINKRLLRDAVPEQITATQLLERVRHHVWRRRATAARGISAAVPFPGSGTVEDPS